jgi:DNA-directed RNA polymerase specialized sigma24 family protein
VTTAPERPPAETDGRAHPERDDALFAELYPGLRRFAAAVAADDLDPDDLLQEAVARTLRGGPIHRLDAPGAYLRTAMVHLAANHDRSKGRERRAHQRAAAGIEPDRAEAYPSDLGELGRLRSDDRAVLYLADVERLPLPEVARILGTNAPAARARASRARRRLATALQQGATS